MYKVKIFDEFVYSKNNLIEINENKLFDKVKNTIDFFTDNPKKYINKARTKIKDFAKEYKYVINFLKQNSDIQDYDEVEQKLREEFDNLNNDKDLKKIIRWIKDVVIKENDEWIKAREKENCPWYESKLPKSIFHTLTDDIYWTHRRKEDQMKAYQHEKLKKEIKNAFGIDSEKEPFKYIAVLAISACIANEIEDAHLGIGEYKKRGSGSIGGGSFNMFSAAAACVR